MKKMIFRATLMLFTFVLAFASLPFSASAENTVAVASSEFLTHQGETFTTTIYIPDNANIVDFDITVNYDTDLVTLVSAVENEDIKGTAVFNAENEGEIVINYTRTSKNVTEYLPLIDLTFTVNDNIGIGTYECLSVDRTKTYIAHTLTASGVLDEVPFDCGFSKLVIYEMGDVDLNCSVNIADASYIRRHLAAIEGATLSEFKLTLADTYYDNEVNIADAICLQRHLARLDVMYGNRVNITFMDMNGQKYASKSVLYDGTLTNIPAVPQEEGYAEGVWSASASEYVQPILTNLKKDVVLYPYYEGGKSSEAVAYYKRMLTDQYYSGDLPTNLSSDLNLWSTLYYQNGYYANLIWNSDCNYVLNSTTGEFTKPIYPQDMTLTAKIISYDSNNMIEAEDTISFKYAVPGEFIIPEKEKIADWISHYFTDSTDGKYRVNYDVKLLSKLSNTIIPVEGSAYDNFEIRLKWYQVVDGVEVPISRIKRTSSGQVNDYVAVATFNGKPIEGDGKIYVDDVEVTAIEQLEIKDYIIKQIAANMGTVATDGTVLWNNDTVYGTTVTWETGNADIAYIANNVIELKADAVSGSTLPLNARVSYATDSGTEEFVLSYNLTVSCDNTKIKAPENMDEELYKAIKAELEEELGYRGDLTSAALADVRFVNLDLSDYPDIASLRGLSYCSNLRTLNISGLKITDGTMNQIATLSYLEAFIARGCELDNLSDGGTPTLRNAVRLKMIDLTDNNFTSLDSVFADGVKYGNLREVYLSDNKLTDINALQRAPIVTYLSLSNNGLTTEGTAAIANYPHLRYLSLAHNKIDSVQHLTGLKYLNELRLHHNNLSDVRALRTLVNLQALYLGHNNIQDISFFNSLTGLQLLYVNDNAITDISTLSTLNKLEILNVNNNKISSLSVLRNYTGTLREIYAENNKLTDFSFINGASKLHVLTLSGNKVEIAQSNMSRWLAGLSEMEALTLSDIRLTDLAFLDSMSMLARLDVANCGLRAFTGDDSNIEHIADRYSTLRVLDLSNNDMRGYEEELLKLRNNTLLTLFFADNVCDGLDAYTLTYSMPELKSISFENCGINSISWLFKYNNLEYVDLAGNNISSMSFDSDISNASIKTLKELYLDTNVPCTFTNAYNVTDFNIEKLSLEGIYVEKVSNLPYLDNIKYLNLANTGITQLEGGDPELASLYSIARYTTAETLDLSGLQAEIGVAESLPNLKTLYAVGATDSKLFYESNLHALQRLYNKGITCYLYDKDTTYKPVAQTEGAEVLALLEDISCDVTVAADNVLSDDNPFMVSEINDFDITWSVSNSDNYEIVDNYLAVKDYTGIEDEALTITASITVYPDQEPVTREFTINTKILRASSEYFDIDATGYSKQLTRDKTFTYDLQLKAAQTDGFAEWVKPVADDITYSYSAVDQNGESIGYYTVLNIGDNHTFTVMSEAQLGATATIKIAVSHNAKDGTVVNDVEEILIPVTVASRTFTVTAVLNGGQLLDANGINHESFECVEDSLIFDGLTVQKIGYLFEGWYTDEAFDNEYSKDGSDAIMPSENLTLYAKWKAHSFNLNFDANGGSVTETTRLVLCDTAFGTLPTPTRDYYTFNGWFTAASGGEKVDASTVRVEASDLTLYAHWTRNTYTLSFNANGGSVSTSSRTENCGDAIGSLPTPTRDYYTFNGWFTAATGGTKVTADTVYKTQANVTVYAQWTQKPVSGWVKASEMPAGAQVVNTKWSYTLREYTNSTTSSSLSGWTKYDTQRTSWGATQGPVYSNPSNGSRNVWSEQYVASTTKHYKYYHRTNGSLWGTDATAPGWARHNIDLTYALTAGYYSSEYRIQYYKTYKCSSCGNDHMWIPDGTYTVENKATRWYYQEPVYTYYFYRDVNKDGATSDPTGQANVSNVVKWVQYREK